MTMLVVGGLSLPAAAEVAMPAGGASAAFAFLDPSSHETLVTGQEEVSRDGDVVVKHTTYKTVAGGIGQVEDVRFDATSMRLLSYHFDDKLTGEMADVQVTGTKAKAKYRENLDKDTEEKELEWSSDALCGKAVPELILANWSKIAAGEAVPFELYVPFRLETIGFRAVRRDDGLVAVEARNWLIRQLAPAITFAFSESTPPKLTQYRGPSMVAIGGEKNRKVEMQFQ